MNIVTARSLQLIGCEVCGLVCRPPAGEEGLRCPRCFAALHRRKPNSLARTWAFLLSAAILYLPANLLPIMDTRSLGSQRSDTILSGVVVLWQEGSWELAIIVFVASIVVPMLKIAVLTLLLLTVQWRSNWRPAERARLYRLVEFVGHWSMLDVFVVVLMATLVQFQAYAQVGAGPGAIAFGAVVVLTMLASRSFDPRLIWDAATPAQASSDIPSVSTGPKPMPPQALSHHMTEADG